MSAVLKLLLLTAGTLLVSAQKWNNLPESYKKHIDKALEKANNIFGGSYHVAFERMLDKPSITDSSWFVNVLLVVTDCTKNKEKGYHKHRDECVSRKPRTPWINCVVCTAKNDPEIIDCVRHAEVKKREKLRDQCSYYLAGGAHAMSQTSEDKLRDPWAGCLGCI